MTSRILNSGTLLENNYYLFGNGSPGTGQHTLIFDRIYFIPLRVPICFNAKELGFFITVIATFAQKMVIGIYDFDPITGNPLNLLYQVPGELALDSGTGYKFLNSNFNFDPGIYYVAYSCNSGGASAKIRVPVAIHDPILPQNSGGQISISSFRYLSILYSSLLPNIIIGTIIDNIGVDFGNFIIKVGQI